MASVRKNADAHLILDAVQFATDADLAAFRQVVATSASLSNAELQLRILLTFLPENTDPDRYTDLVKDIAAGNLNALDNDDAPTQPSPKLSEEEARRQVHGLRLATLQGPDHLPEDSDLLIRFLVRRAHKIDSETGSLLLIHKLLVPFINYNSFLQAWIGTTINPLLRCELESTISGSYTLESFEALTGPAGLKELLARASKHASEHESNIGWFLREVVGPWIYGQGSKAGRAIPRADSSSDGEITTGTVKLLFDHLNTWILDLSKGDFTTSCSIFEQWNGPTDVNLDHPVGSPSKEQQTLVMSGYARAGMACLYNCEETGVAIWSRAQVLLTRVAELSALPAFDSLDSVSAHDVAGSLPSSFLSSISKTDILSMDLLRESNPLTSPCPESMVLAFLCLASSRKLDELRQKVPVKDVLMIGLFGSELQQKALVQKILHGLLSSERLDDRQWAKIRHDLLRLQNWNGRHASHTGISCAPMGRLEAFDLEVEIFRALLSDERLALVLKLFSEPRNQPLPRPRMEQLIVEAGWKAYDNASNGNKTRGGVKKASQIVDAFGSTFPESMELRQLSALIQATHSLSFYSLTLQHGVPLVPAKIRMHQSPLSLINKVLGQNPKAYTKLDDLLGIGLNLSKAGLVEASSPNAGHKSQTALGIERSIIAATIRSALASDDFDTAYAYIVNRLSDSGDDSGDLVQDDVLWTVALEAGRYQPTSGSGLTSRRHLEQRMELLSQALVLAPPSSISEGLDAWRQAETDAQAASNRESEKDSAWRRRGDRQPPGAFVSDDAPSGRSKGMESAPSNTPDEAPMGLFDVARGAAAALQKSAFPLHGQRNVTVSRQGDSRSEVEAGYEGRVRKRDVVSNMVTGGLASGIGWVLGAQPVKEES